MANKPIHLRMKAKNPSGRQAMWEAIRAHKDGFTLTGLANSFCDLKRETLRTYLRALVKGGYVIKSVGRQYKNADGFQIVQRCRCERPERQSPRGAVNVGKRDAADVAGDAYAAGFQLSGFGCGGINGRNSVGYVDGQNLCDCAVPRGIFAAGGQRTLRVYRCPLYGTARADDSTSENRVRPELAAHRLAAGGER